MTQAIPMAQATQMAHYQTQRDKKDGMSCFLIRVCIPYLKYTNLTVMSRMYLRHVRVFPYLFLRGMMRGGGEYLLQNC